MRTLKLTMRELSILEFIFDVFEWENHADKHDPPIQDFDGDDGLSTYSNPNEEELSNLFSKIIRAGGLRPKSPSEYKHNNAMECKVAGDHLNTVDDDGYCNICGHQE